MRRISSQVPCFTALITLATATDGYDVEISESTSTDPRLIKCVLSGLHLDQTWESNCYRPQSRLFLGLSLDCSHISEFIQRNQLYDQEWPLKTEYLSLPLSPLKEGIVRKQQNGKRTTRTFHAPSFLSSYAVTNSRVWHSDRSVRDCEVQVVSNYSETPIPITCRIERNWSRI